MIIYSALQNYSPPLDPFHALSCFNDKCKCILLGFYVKDQHKVVHNCEVERKLHMVYLYFLRIKNRKVWCAKVFPP